MEEHQRVVLTHTYTHRDGDILHTHLHEIHRAEQSKAHAAQIPAKQIENYANP